MQNDYVLNHSKDKDCEIVYMTGTKITRRKIHVYEVTDTSVKAYCYLRRSIRLFKKEGILSASFYN